MTAKDYPRLTRFWRALFGVIGAAYQRVPAG
jgi:hypothetical protein